MAFMENTVRMAGTAVVPRVLAEGTEMDSARDWMAVVVLHITAVTVHQKWQPARGAAN
jgi:hypothetical protein